MTQVALGTFLATALFAMVVLAALPADVDADARLPDLSLAVTMTLVFASSGLFVYYLHHVTTVMRVSHIIAAVGAQSRRVIEEQYPVGPAAAPVTPLPPPVQVITAVQPAWSSTSTSTGSPRWPANTTAPCRSCPRRATSWWPGSR
ncbi:DUF2254 family protein [Micromonospora sp. WMMB482]|uniref:DUF2254 family protein n=1 Tax=Micromonospora sp. WMMB482 TaxID=2849653 RepID=UPI0027E1345A|nr:DUF2254 family protein [Micromonospora sp. WMMB482]